MKIFFYRYKIFLPEQAVNLFLPVNRVTGKKIHNPSYVEVGGKTKARVVAAINRYRTPKMERPSARWQKSYHSMHMYWNRRLNALFVPITHSKIKTDAPHPKRFAGIAACGNCGPIPRPNGGKGKGGFDKIPWKRRMRAEQAFCVGRSHSKIT